MNNAHPEHWPPQHPHEGSSKVAEKMFFEHLRSLVKAKTNNKKALHLAARTTDLESVIFGTEFFDDDTTLYVNAGVSARTRQKVEGIFSMEADADYFFDTSLVAETFNTLPNELDLKVLADALISDFCEAQEGVRDNPGSVRVFDASTGKEGRGLNDDEIELMERSFEHAIGRARSLYFDILNRRVQAPKISKEPEGNE